MNEYQIGNVFIIQQLTECMKILVRYDLIGKLTKLIEEKKITDEHLKNSVDLFDGIVFGEKITDDEIYEKMRYLINNN